MVYYITRFSQYTSGYSMTSCKIPANGSYNFSLRTADNSAIEGLVLASKRIYFNNFKSDNKYSVPYLRLETYK